MTHKDEFLTLQIIEILYNITMFLMRLVKTIFISLLAVSLVAVQPSSNSDQNDVDSHLAEFSKYNETHHDNIDDEPHTHTHKHSEDGDEHEHNHEHSKVTQSEIKLLNQSVKVLAQVTIIKTNRGFSQKNLISNPHPDKIYRPPIYS